MEKNAIISSDPIHGEPVPDPEFTVGVSVDCVIFGFEDNKLKVLLIKSDMHPYEDHWSLLGDIVNPDEDNINSWPGFSWRYEKIDEQIMVNVR